MRFSAVSSKLMPDPHAIRSYGTLVLANYYCDACYCFCCCGCVDGKFQRQDLRHRQRLPSNFSIAVFVAVYERLLLRKL